MELFRWLLTLPCILVVFFAGVASAWEVAQGGFPFVPISGGFVVAYFGIMIWPDGLWPKERAEKSTPQTELSKLKDDISETFVWFLKLVVRRPLGAFERGAWISHWRDKDFVLEQAQKFGVKIRESLVVVARLLLQAEQAADSLTETGGPNTPGERKRTLRRARKSLDDARGILSCIEQKLGATCRPCEKGAPDSITYGCYTVDAFPESAPGYGYGECVYN